MLLHPNGRFQARIVGRVKGNVLLRKKQYLVSEDKTESTKIATSFLLGKISNCRRVIERAIRDHSVLLNVEELKKASESLKNNLRSVEECTTLTDLMGFEGVSAKEYFGIFNH
jgi:CRISPR-associated protein Cas1